ncbi:MAG: CpsD/CapB family tyrosine-protein kinase [Desulfatibacillaceae bacterium]
MIRVRKAKNNARPLDGAPLATKYPARSMYREAYRTLRTNVDLSFVNQGYRSLLVTSSGQAEGKTMTVANYGHSLAEAGKSVLLVDTDLRRPALARVMGNGKVQKSGGFTGLLSDIMQMEIGEGEIGQASVADVLKLIILQRATGRLILKGPIRHLMFTFSSGRLADCLQPREPQPSAGQTGPVQDDGQAAGHVSGKRTVLARLEEGSLKRARVDEEMDDLVFAPLAAALKMTQGKFAFIPEEVEDPDQQGVIGMENFQGRFRQITENMGPFPYLGKLLRSKVLSTKTPNLHVMPPGAVPPNPSELLAGEAARFVMELMKRQFDIVIFDSPPILPASDALSIAPLVDGILFVVKEGELPRKSVKKAVEQLQKSRNNIVGVVFNNVDTKNTAYRDYYNKYYYGYGD